MAYKQINPEEARNQALISFMQGLIGGKINEEKRQQQVRRDQYIYKRGQESAAAKERVKYFMELSKSEDPDQARAGFQGLQELGIITKMPNLRGDRFPIPDLNSKYPYGDIFSSGEVERFYASQNRSAYQWAQMSANERQMLLNEKKTLLNDVTTQMKDLTTSEGFVLDENKPKMKELYFKSQSLQKDIDDLENFGKQSNQNNQTQTQVQQIITKAVQALDSINKSLDSIGK